MVVSLTSPVDKQQLELLKSGDEVLISGTLYTGRDAAHKRMIEMLGRGEPLPFEIKGQIIYYVGPCPAPPGKIMGSAGPTTSGRMDAYAPKLLDMGLSGMIGKGLRNDQVVSAIKRNGAVYLGATGGAGALIASCITKEEIIAFEDLDTEAVRRLEVSNFPCIVIIDSLGNDLYATGRAQYEKKAQGS